jgi:hypothetical protein
MIGREIRNSHSDGYEEYHFLGRYNSDRYFNQSSICLSPDRSIASSKLSSPKSAILSFLLQLFITTAVRTSNPIFVQFLL